MKLSKLKSTVAVFAGVAGLMAATSASAAIYNFALGDHPDGAISAYDYGLRIDNENPDRFFSFSNNDATLSFNDTTGTVSIFGTMIESDGSGGFGGTFAIDYQMTGVSTNTGPGTFIETAGTGTGSIDGISLDAKANGAGQYFILEDDGYRLGGHAGWASDTFVGRGWVLGNGTGSNDFLFTATLDSTVPGPTPVPVPAAGLLMLAGLGGLGVMRRRKKG